MALAGSVVVTTAKDISALLGGRFVLGMLNLQCGFIRV